MTDNNNKKINILIAEDERNIGDLLVEILEAPDRDICIVHNGNDAIKELQERQFDLLITDLMMPDADGIEVLHRARELYPHILVIIITGYASLETAIQAVKEGAYDYLRKPFRLDELRISVDNACDKIALIRENRMLLRHMQDSYARSQDSSVEDNPGSESIEFDRAFVDIDRLPPSFFETGVLDRNSPLDKLERLVNMKREGMITESEFTILKKKLIDSI
jgi:DNA-binding NtrC family response regulator